MHLRQELTFPVKLNFNGASSIDFRFGCVTTDKEWPGSLYSQIHGNLDWIEYRASWRAVSATGPARVKAVPA